MRAIFILLLFLFVYPAKSQLNVGAWRDHLPYQSCRKVVKIGTKIYCSTENNLFTYDTKDNSLQKLSKITGLSDIGVANMEYYTEKNILLIAYSNGNIDLLKGQTIINISDVYKQTFPGSKKANHIFFRQNFAYVSYSFGIVVIDLVKNEIKDTYVVGENGTTYEVFSTVADDNYFYAATAKGIFKGGVNDPFLVNYLQWKRDVTIPNNEGNFNTLGIFSGKVIANFNGSADKTDTLYYQDTNGWKRFLTGENLNHYEIRSFGDQLLVSGLSHVYLVNTTFQLIQNIDNYGFGNVNPSSAILDESGNVWIADKSNGLVLKQANTSGYRSIYPNGPTSSHSWKMLFNNGSLHVTGGGEDASTVNFYNKGELFTFKDETWSSIYNWDGYDYNCLAADPSDPQKIYVGSWGTGVYAYKDGQETAHFTDKNSTLQNIIPGDVYVRIGGMVFDNKKNLWVTNSGVGSPISVMKPDGKWKSFPWGSYINCKSINDINIDRNGRFWVVLPFQSGLFVFEHKGTIDDGKDSLIKFKPLSAFSEVISNVYCVTNDRDGSVWVGTDKGPVIYTNPENIFDGETAGKQVTIGRTDGSGLADVLLGAETINCITVDGANRKWFGTEKGGVFLFSPDGTRQIYHFNTSNSPIFSNTVRAIGINDLTGEVFFGTDKGIISFRPGASMPNEDFTNVYVFPNPVRPDYEGIITITGLIENTIVKITDISGNLVYQTKSLGGTATWDGKGHGGRKVATGVYLVFCSNEDGSKTFVTKMLVIH